MPSIYSNRKVVGESFFTARPMSFYEKSLIFCCTLCSKSCKVLFQVE